MVVWEYLGADRNPVLIHSSSSYFEHARCDGAAVSCDLSYCRKVRRPDRATWEMLVEPSVSHFSGGLRRLGGYLGGLDVCGAANPHLVTVPHR
jgi:hypothetical protein